MLLPDRSSTNFLHQLTLFPVILPVRNKDGLHRLFLMTLNTTHHDAWRGQLRQWMAFSQWSHCDFILSHSPLLFADMVTLLDTEKQCPTLLASSYCCCHCSVTFLHTFTFRKYLNTATYYLLFNVWKLINVRTFLEKVKKDKADMQ